jgi:hypothetical protein
MGTEKAKGNNWEIQASDEYPPAWKEDLARIAEL